MSNLAGFWHYGNKPCAANVCSEILTIPHPGSGFGSAQSPGVRNKITFDGSFVAFGLRQRGSSLKASLSRSVISTSASPSDPDFYPSPEGRYHLVGDLRIDNRAALVAALELDGGAAGLLSNSSILLAAFGRWRDQCVGKIAGSFAFAIWDSVERELFLARDPAGDKPLYYHSGSRYFAFASTARALLQCPDIDPSLDETHLALSLCGMPSEHSRTYLKAVNCVLPGHSVVVRRGSVTQSQYWHLEDVPDIRFARDQEYVEAFLEVFDEAVRCRLASTGNMATELSAGLDSSSVCATAARLLAAQGQGLIAFTSVPSVDLTGRYPARYMPDEGPAAAEVARMYPNIEHKLVKSTGSNLIRELQRTHPALDRPMANAMNHIWINLIQEQAGSDGAHVLLNGERGNLTISTPGMLRDVVRRGGVFSALRLARQHGRRWGPLLKNAFTVTRAELLPRALRPRLDPRFQQTTLNESPINPKLASELGMLDRFREYILEPTEDFRVARWKNFNSFDLGDFHLAAQNTWDIDRRDPTSDKRVLAFCLGIPMEQYVVGGMNCSLIRRAMRGRLPELTLNQPLKGLQSGDWYESLSAIVPEMMAELDCVQRSSLAQRMLDLPRLRRTLESWPATASGAMLDEPRYHSALTSGIAWGYFLRKFEGTD